MTAIERGNRETWRLHGPVLVPTAESGCGGIPSGGPCAQRIRTMLDTLDRPGS
jgi:hypothetical protein